MFFTLTIFLNSQDSISASKSKIVTDSLPGKDLFRRNCGMCHFVNKPFIGPALNRINERNKNWLISFIRNSSKLMLKRDSITMVLYEQYGYVEHPNFKILSKNEIKEIITYIERASNSNSH